MAWKAYWKTAIATACGVAAFFFVTIVMIDPYNSIWFSVPLDRVPVSSNQRFSYPAIARNSAFDSVVVGTSTTRLLRPEKLDEALGGHFANLSMNSATAYEQEQIFDLFMRHHPSPRTVLIGIDVVWCGTGDTLEKFTPRPFPPWLYDENRWNDLLHVFNMHIIEEVGRLIGYFLGLRDARYGIDGYGNFLPPRSKYDLARVRKALYGEQGPQQRPPSSAASVVGAAERRSWRFPALPLLTEMLSAVPAGTRKIAVFVPYHYYSQPVEGSREAARWEECKRRVTGIVQAAGNGHALDFMLRSKITLDDENYWDPLHYGVKTADRLVDLIAAGVEDRCGIAGLMDYLTVPPSEGGEVRACARPTSTSAAR